MAAKTTSTAKTKPTSRDSCSCPKHRTPDRRRTVHARKPPCAGCTGWVRQYCPRSRECA